MEEKNNTNTSLEDKLAPSAVNVSSNSIQIGEKLVRILFISTLPRYLNTQWFSPIINLDRVLDISIFFHPADSGTILKKLRDKLARLQAQAIEESSQGKVRNPILDTAISDIEDLRDKIQQGTDRFFEFGVYVAIYGDGEKDLDETESKIRSIFEAQLIYLKPATFRMKEGFLSTLPLDNDLLNAHNSLNTEPVSSIFPFVSYDLTSDKGILYGINTHNNSLILFDRFSLENYNSVVFGKSGGGKSILGSESVLIRKNGQIEKTEIGPLVDMLIAKHGAKKIDRELEGVINPGMEVWSFDKNLKGSWSKVTVAARKEATPYFYRFATKSGRVITTTGDHNMIVTRNGQVIDVKSSEIKEGEFVPLPRQIEPAEQPTNSLNLLKILEKVNGIYISGAEKIINKNYKILRTKRFDARDRYLYKYRIGRVIPLGYLLKILDFLEIDLDSQVLDGLKVTSKTSKRDKILLPVYLSITPSFAKILGYIVSEGTITDRAVVISNLDLEVIADIQTALKSLGILNHFTGKSVNIADRVFVEIVKSLGGKKKSAKKDVLPFLFSTDRRIIASYLQAYFEGDGGVEHSSVCAVSKSKKLISELSYLLYYFGIVSRISKNEKKAQGWRTSKTYWKLTISGQDNLKKFANNINFVSERKKNLLAKISSKNGNTNVDVIPGLAETFQEIYNLIPSKLHNFPEISALKHGVYNPSPQMLAKVIQKIETIIADFKLYENSFKPLSLLSLDSIIDYSKNKILNHKLWQTLGSSWAVIKNRQVAPRALNVLKTLSLINGYNYALADIKTALHFGFKELGLPIKHHNKSLQVALVEKPLGNTKYEMLWEASRYVRKSYQERLANINHLENLLERLKTLANGDLFWDPIVKIEKIKNVKEKYVYDLTVDNEVFLAGTGGMFVHNSYTVKLEILRTLMMGTEVFIIDPENEYKYLADTVGGSSINISIASDSHINPFDLPEPREDEEFKDIFRTHILDLTGLFKLMLGELTPEEDSLLDEALIQTYALKDITPEKNKGGEEVPLLSDFQNILEGLAGAESLAIRIRKYTEGTFAGFLNKPTNVSLNNRLVLFSIRDMEEELRPIAMYLILNYVWTKVRTELKRRILVVDEAWWLLKYEVGGAFLFNVAKRARKYFLGLTTISQDVPDFLGSQYGKAIVTNSSIQTLMKQSPASIDGVKQTFNLTDAEKFYLLEAAVGHGLFFAGSNHVGIRVVASYTEDQIITSDPRQILEIEKAKREWARETGR